MLGVKVIMNRFLVLAGILAVAILIIILIKIIDDYFDDRKAGTEISEKIYNAAEEFSNGTLDDEVKTILLNCIDLDEDDIDEILELSTPQRNDEDGGYNAFIKVVRKVLKNY